MQGRLRDLIAIIPDGKCSSPSTQEPVEIHLPHPYGDDPMTLCGHPSCLSDGNDLQVSLPRGARVTCKMCLAVWREAKLWGEKAFSPELV